MRQASGGNRSLRRGDAGAALVEFALVLPVMTLVVFGMLEFGMGLNNKSSLQQGTREGARQASVADFGGDTGCTVEGASPGSTTKELLCLVKDRVELDESRVRVKIDFTTTNDHGEQLSVCTLYPLDSVTGFFEPVLSGRFLEAKVQTRIEEKDADLEEVAETPPSGADWSFCG